MKLRNCFLTAVFFSVGMAFAIAEEAVDEDTFWETTYTLDRSGAAETINAYTLSFSKTTWNKTGDSTQLAPNGIDEPRNGRNDYTTGYKNDGADMAFQGDSDSDAPDPNESRNIYNLSNSFYDSIPEEIGFTARDDVENPLVFTDIIAEEPNDMQLPNQETFSLLFFDKNMFTSAHNWGQILSESYYYDGGGKENVFVSFSSVITVVFACLSVMFGMGFLLILFTVIGKINA